MPDLLNDWLKEYDIKPDSIIANVIVTGRDLNRYEVDIVETVEGKTVVTVFRLEDGDKVLLSNNR